MSFDEPARLASLHAAQGRAAALFAATEAGGRFGVFTEELLSR
ncbi:MAG: hypothetical protein WA047_05280 [Phenylobacterium sp.]